MDDKREQLAAYAHEAWSGWMRYMFQQGGGEMIYHVEGEELFCWMMSPTSFQRWQRQMKTPYADLPESEKESDRSEADRILAIINGTAQ